MKCPSNDISKTRSEVVAIRGSRVVSPGDGRRDRRACHEGGSAKMTHDTRGYHLCYFLSWIMALALYMG